MEKGSSSMSAAEHKAIIARYQEEVWNNGNIALVDDLFAAGFLDHNAPDSRGPAGVKEAVTKNRTAFPDFRGTVEDLIAEGDKVVARITWTGTNTGDFFGRPATGKHVTSSAILIFRFADGKIVEEWGSVDALGLVQQLSQIPG
jgi:steroid delta-isomerase-like uncharacterized protein